MHTGSIAFAMEAAHVEIIGETESLTPEVHEGAELLFCFNHHIGCTSQFLWSPLY